MMQQIIGAINLSLPVIISYQFYPALFQSYWGMFISALMVGVSTYFLNKRATDTMINALKYKPSDEYRERFDAMIRQCNIDPHDVAIVYAYTNEQTILTAFNTIIMDPIVWASIASDTEAGVVTAIFEQYTLPNLSEMQKQRLAEIKKICTPDVEAFFFRRQLAHVYHHFSTKKLFVIGFVGTLAAYVGIMAAMSILHINGILAACVGIMVGCVADLAFTYLSNALFKLPEEKAADRFAVEYSSCQEIEAAATFFEQHQKIKDTTFKDETNLLSFLPSVFARGHLTGIARAKFLRNLAAQKNCTQ